MICNNCNAYVEDDANVCSNCGTPVKKEEDIYSTNTYSANTYQSLPNVLLWGILGLAFALTPYINFLGIIFSAKAKNYGNQVISMTGTIQSGGKVGYTLGKVGFILGIVFTAFWTIYLIVLIGILASI